MSSPPDTVSTVQPSTGSRLEAIPEAPAAPVSRGSSSSSGDVGRSIRLPKVRLGTLGRGRYSFSFVLENVGDEEMSVAVTEQNPEIRFYQKEYSIAPKSRMPIIGWVDTRDLSLGSHRLGLSVGSSEGSATTSVRLRVASVKLPVVIGLGYIGVFAQGTMVRSDLLVTLGSSACLIVTLLLWQRLRQWQFAGLAFCMALTYAMAPYVGQRLAGAAPAQPPANAAVSASSAPATGDGIVLD